MVQYAIHPPGLPAAVRPGVGKKNMTNTQKYTKYAEFHVLERYVSVTFREFYWQHYLWFYVQVYTAVVPWTCSVCWLHTGSSCFRQVTHYTQFRAEHRFVCAGPPLVLCAGLCSSGAVDMFCLLTAYRFVLFSSSNTLHAVLRRASLRLCCS